MTRKTWVVHAPDRDRQAALVQALSISPITACVLLARGVATEQEARAWLAPGSLHDPFLLPDMETAVRRLHHAVTTGERVCFYGDYDVDGMAATSLYLSFFQGLGANATWYIPHRIGEGYGLNDKALRRLGQDGVTLLVTSDCGTTAHPQVEVATRSGIEVIITDHHQPDGRLPAALAVLNPHRTDSAYPFSGLCSGGLAYKVAQAYVAMFGAGDRALELMQDLVALATVADVVPLQDENRLLVRRGLELITRGSRCGLRALKRTAGVDRACTAGSVAFRLAPRLNAAGRMAQADLGVRLLTTESDLEARELAEQLERLNRERQRIELDTTSEAVEEVGSAEPPPALVLWSRHWHPGVIGIVAARLVERYHRPAVVIAVNEQGIGKGSARSVPGLDLFQAFGQCQSLLEGFGGHRAAAGLTIHESSLMAFRERFTRIVSDWAGEQPQVPTLHVDAEVSLVEVDRRLVRELAMLHPHGAGNPEPTLAVRNLAILDTRVVGEGHLKLTVRHRHSPAFESIGFRMGSLAGLGVLAQRPVDLAFVPELSSWNGLDRVQLRIRDVRASQVS